MSAYAARLPAAEGESRRLLRSPAEGWASIVLSVIIVMVMARAVDDPAWVNGREALTDPLIPMSLLGFAFGALGPKVGWGRWTTHMIGALFAGLLIPILAGWAMVPGASPAAAFHIAAEGSAEAYLDIAWRGLQYTSQEVHYIVVLGALMWGTAQFFGYAVFGHHKALNGVVMVGIVLVGNMSLIQSDQLAFLVVFTSAALLLLITMHAFDERTTWIRRRIGDPSELASMYLKGGSVLIAVATIASVMLATRAASSPLAGAWDGIDNQLISIGEEIARLFPVGPDVRGGREVIFGSSAVIRPTWRNGDGTAFTAKLDAEMPEVRWRAATYDTFALGAWVQTDVASNPVEAGSALLAGTPEEPLQDLSIPVSASIEADEYKGSLALAPGAPVAIDRVANVLLQGEEHSFAGVDLPGGNDRYTIEAAVLKLAVDDPLAGTTEGITGNQLRAASRDYPPEISARYTDVPADALGPHADELLATFLAAVPDRNPYVLAEVMQDYLQSDRFQYSVDGTGPCDVVSKVECFAANRRGYCLHYASTMAILLRAANPENRIPTRLVQGFLPGTRDPAGRVETVAAQNAHAWVEVYFPGYGWIPFDPTGGGIGRETVIPLGPAVAPAAPTPAGSRRPEQPDPSRRLEPDDGSGTVTAPASQKVDRTLLVVLLVVLVAIVVGLAVLSWMRGPRTEINVDTAWTTMLRAASRFGFGPRPTQTIYEYAGSLADLVPVAREDLRTVADAKVETQYAQVQLGADRIEAVRDATRRLRVTLLRLALRRPGRRRRRL